MTRSPAQAAWALARAGAVAAYAGLVALVALRPAVGLPVLWGIVVPLLPAVFVVAPGLWRNVCPMAATNQLPRALGLTRAGALPGPVRRHGYVGALALFLAIVAARKAGMDDRPGLVAALLVALLAAALAGGVAFAGKSGWCGALCPLRPTQGLYAQAPVATVPTAHCRPCVGCTDNCPDLKPGTAHRDDVLAPDRRRSRPRAVLAGALPGLILAFHASPATGATGVLHLAVAALATLGVLLLVESATRWPADRVVAVFAAASLALHGWFGAPAVIDTVGTLAGAIPPPWLPWLAREHVVVLSALWLVRAWARTGTSVSAAPAAPLVPAAPPVVRTREYVGPDRRSADRAMRMVTVTLADAGTSTEVRPGTSLAAALRALGAPTPSGCGVGACGSDPVRVVAGAAALSPPGEAEAATLGRLGLGGAVRLACSARVQGDVTVAPGAPGAVPAAPTGAPRPVRRARPPRPRRRVVVVGGGVAGLTAAEYVRRADPDARVQLVGSEREPAYHRTALLDVAARGLPLERLHLRPPTWHADHDVERLAGRFAAAIDREHRELLLADGARLGYDALVLATGSRARVPAVAGFGRPGSFLLRSAEHAGALRRHLDLLAGGRAVVAGGGPLGVETAAALAGDGVAVTLVASGPLLPRHLDARAARLLGEHLRGLGVDVRAGARVQALAGGERVSSVVLEGGQRLPAELVVACAGVVPNAELARAAGLAVARGVVVDERMRTADPAVWAAGDVAEHAGRVDGLWATAVRQAEVAASAITGGGATYAAGPAVVVLDLPGAHLAVLGEPGAGSAGGIVVAGAGRYCRLAIAGGRLTGAVLWDAPAAEQTLQRAIERGLDVRPLRGALAAGDWDAVDRAMAGRGARPRRVA